MKRVWITILGVLNIIAFCVLAFWYYLYFRNGQIYEAFTWGLPELIAALLALSSGILAMKRRSWRWGVTGLVVAVAVFLYIWIFLWLYSIGI